MKKLIMFAAVAVLAYASQAATYNWASSAAVYGVNAAAVTDNGDYSAGTTYMRNNGTWNVVLSLYEAGTYGTANQTLIGSSASTGVKFSTTGNKFNTSSIEVAAAEQGVTYDYVFTITGTQNALTSRGVDGSYDYSAASLTTEITGSIDTAGMGPTKITSGVPATWTITGITPVAVPEPTSGLLMLVGLGALALRRRRA